MVTDSPRLLVGLPLAWLDMPSLTGPPPHGIKRSRLRVMVRLMTVLWLMPCQPLLFPSLAMLSALSLVPALIATTRA